MIVPDDRGAVASRGAMGTQQNGGIDLEALLGLGRDVVGDQYVRHDSLRGVAEQQAAAFPCARRTRVSEDCIQVGC